MFNFNEYIQALKLLKVKLAVKQTPKEPSAPRIPRDPQKAKYYVLNKVLSYYIDVYNKKYDDYRKSYISLHLFDLYNSKQFKLYKGNTLWKDANEFMRDVYKNKYLYKFTFKKYKLEFIEDRYNSEVYNFVFIAPACKEFDSLNLYIKNTLKCAPIPFDKIYAEYVDGKRSHIFSRNGKCLLAHNPQKCKLYKQLLLKMRKANWTAKLEYDDYTYWGDRFNSYGEDMEIEWSGYELEYGIIKFFTPKGKLMDLLELYANHLVAEEEYIPRYRQRSRGW